MTRLTRAESQAQTRQQLVASARRLFVADGFLATSLEKVAAESGFSKGAVYSNFDNKFELGLAVLDQIHGEQLRLLGAEIGPARSPDALVQGFARWADQNIGSEEWTMLELEVLTAARQQPTVLDDIRARRELMIAALVELTREKSAELHLRLTMSVERVVQLAFTMGVGIGVRRAVDPSVTVEALVELFASVLDGGPRSGRAVARP